MVRTVNIRALKDKLSAYLHDVQRGDVVLVSDRGRVVAELREPTLALHSPATTAERLDHLARRGLVRRGLPNRAELYRSTGRGHPREILREALDWTRGDR